MFTFMKESSSNGSEVLGTETAPPKVEIPTIEVIEKWLAKDVGSMISLLSAIQADKDLRLHMATFIQGRYSNMVSKPDPAQVAMDFGKGPKRSK